ncbi:glycosyltransferase [Candidatus Woesearchaeota archaeon]|nr:glycosyltransferase [Candidatus Woesearchaeota archaeon]MCF7900769.1 glycosyltransferase [Candidatus Woesearchaeota archaeon]MCF8012934.1 glycosyltransferase [Candidatus Woesearchaeota archaeon]
MKSTNPKISIIVAVHNGEKYIDRCIKSLINQTYKNYELLIVDDGSTDNSRLIIKKYTQKYKKISLIKNDKNEGLARSLNKGIKKAKGKYIARIDIDDICLKNRFKKQVIFLENHKNVFLTAGQAYNINKNGECIGITRKFSDSENLKNELLKDNCIIHPTIIFRNDGKTFYREKFTTSQDYDLYLRLLSRNKILAHLNEPVIKYDISSGNDRLSKKLKQKTYTLLAKQFFKERLKNYKDTYEKTDFEIIKTLSKYKINIKRLISKYAEDIITDALKEADLKTVNAHLKHVIGYKLAVFKILLKFPFLYNLYSMIVYKKKILRNLGVIFSFGISIEDWKKSGILNRELKIYERFIVEDIYDKIYLFTYDSKNIIELNKELFRNIVVVPKPKIFKGHLGNIIYSAVLPLIHHRKIKKCSVLKTNQLSSFLPAIISKIIFNKNFIFRTGYTSSLNSKIGDKKIKYLFDSLREFLTYKLAKVSIVTSENQKKYVENKYSVKNVNIIPNYVDTNIFKHISFKAKKDLVYVGRLSEEKNLLNMISAVGRLDKSLDIYGSGPQEERILNYIKKMNFRNINLKGNIENSKIPKILKKYKVYIQTSFYEGNPKTILEAMACGKCCLATNVQGIKEVLIHKETGYLTETSSESIKKGIEYLFKNDKIITSIGLQARQQILRHNSLNKIFEKEVKIHEKFN